MTNILIGVSQRCCGNKEKEHPTQPGKMKGFWEEENTDQNAKGQTEDSEMKRHVREFQSKQLMPRQSSTERNVLEHKK